jgi:hypothetical protein
MVTLKSVMENSFVGKLTLTIAASAIIGGGTVVLNNQSRIAVLENTNVSEDARLMRIESKVDELLLRTPR